MGIFLPRAPHPGDVCDPDRIVRDFQRAASVAEATDHWNWASGAFSSQNLLEKGAHVALKLVSAGVLTGSTDLAYPVLPDSVGADAELWKIPYNRGFAVIGEGTSSVCRHQWTSEYPQLLLVILSVQYVRRDEADPAWSTFFAGTSRNVRTQIRLRVNGGFIEGTGPFAIPLDGKYRGTGYGAKATGLCATGLVMVPAGSHTAEAMAAQPSAMQGDENFQEAEADADTPPSDGVCIGSRTFAVVPFSRGLLLSA